MKRIVEPLLSYLLATLMYQVLAEDTATNSPPRGGHTAKAEELERQKALRRAQGCVTFTRYRFGHSNSFFQKPPPIARRTTLRLTLTGDFSSQTIIGCYLTADLK
jgi:hypothetical protein